MIFAAFKAYSTLKQALIISGLVAVVAGGLYATHLFKVNQAYKNGFTDGETVERKLWEAEIASLRAELRLLNQARQTEIDRIAAEHAVELAKKEEFVETKTDELTELMATINKEYEEQRLAYDKSIAENNELTAEALANIDKGRSNGKSCIVNPYAVPLDRRILQNHNQRRKRFN